jgi:hypothetical protein
LKRVSRRELRFSLIRKSKVRTRTRNVGVCAGPENTVMRNSINIDSTHSRAIVREIGERLRLSLKEDREMAASFRAQIERFRQSEDEAQARG